MTFKLMNIKRLDKNMWKIERSMLFKHKKSNHERAAFFNLFYYALDTYFPSVVLITSVSPWFIKRGT